MSYRAWSCGHNHQQDGEGRTPTCDDANWYLLEAGEESGYSNPVGLEDGDYTLHTRCDDGRFSPATWGSATGKAKDIAHSDGRRLMVRSGGEWVEAP
jgi:hypothetical protein